MFPCVPSKDLFILNVTAAAAQCVSEWKCCGFIYFQST